MLVYVVRRLIAVIPVMLVVATVSFILIRLAPGDPASVIAGPYASTDDIARLQRSLGLDQPLPVQLVKWWGRLAVGDLGDSIFLRRPVIEAIHERLEPTLLLTAWAMLIAVLVGIPVGARLPQVCPPIARLYQAIAAPGLAKSTTRRSRDHNTALEVNPLVVGAP